jgi:hypothetical protein
MSSTTANADLAGLLGELESVTEEARRAFGGLSALQLNWKPSAAEWSVGQCLDHLIETNAQFFPTLDEITKGEKKKTFWEGVPLLPSLWGRFLVNATDPDNTKKYKAPKIFRPSASSIDAQIVERFAEHQKEVAERVRATENLDRRSIKITSPIAKFVTYSLDDAFKILVLHEKRHFRQAERVLEMSGFPQG